MLINTKNKEKHQRLTNVNKNNLIDTLMVFAYFIAPDSLFYEFIEGVKNKKCNQCGNDVGADIVFQLIRQYGGTSIRIPHYSEIEVYKFLIQETAFCEKFLRGRSIASLAQHIKDLLDVPPEVDVEPLVSRFVKISCLKENKNER